MVLLRLVFFRTSQCNFFWLEVGHFRPNIHWALWFILPGTMTPNFHHLLMMCVIHIFSLSIYLSIITRLVTVTVTTIGIAQLYACFIRVNSFFFNLRQLTSRYLNPDLRGNKAAMLTIELHSIDWNWNISLLAASKNGAANKLNCFYFFAT